MELAECLRQAGIVGCGGAGFPAYAKYAGKEIDTIIINGAECEPLLQTDKFIMRNYSSRLIKAADWLTQKSGAGKCVIALKSSYKREIDSLAQAIRENESQVSLHTLDSFFPAGDEQSIVYEVTGKVVPPASIPLSVGCVVSNAATLLCIADAMEGRAYTKKYLTITGEVKEPVIARVPIGTPVNRCLEMAGGPLREDYIVINGGPMMGKILTRQEAQKAFVSKTMSGLIVLPENSAHGQKREISVLRMANRAKSACIQCSFCTQMCPRHLLGHPIEPHRIMRKLAMCKDLTEILDDRDVQNAAICCECGVCEVFACPMGLQPRAVNSVLKKELAKAGFRYLAPKQNWESSRERSFRKIPSKRIAQRAGVEKYEEIQIDKMLELESTQIQTVQIALKQNVGVPSVPAVSTGDMVKEGQIIADCPKDGLGVPLHASVSGRAVVGDTYIRIDTV
ncbi:MAG TPA: SLBB domain-containing protein [Candidatus Choladousia intestinigallinarum]|nr:SLBB domain-containing protein [Candidatus Choladousia intestinigallinarum]